MKSLIFAVLIAALLSGGAWFHNNAGATGYDLPINALASAPNDAEIVVTGKNGLDGPAVIVLRIDDAQSTDYWSRVNLERKVPPGLFTFRVPIASLKTPRRHPLDRQTLTLAKLFASPSDQRVTVEHATVEIPVPVHAPASDVIALDFGPEDGAIFPGFAKVAPGDPMMIGRNLHTRDRPGGDALVADGIEGIERLVLKHRPGVWQVTLWTEDVGEWEYLPHALERRIRINGETAFYRRMTHADWRRQIYLEGRGHEWHPGKTAWDGFGARRGGKVTHVVDSPDGQISIEFAGSNLSATFLSGLVLTSVGDAQTLKNIEAERRKRFDETWRFKTPDIVTEPATDTLKLTGGGTVFAAPGTHARIEITARSPHEIIDPAPSLAAPERLGTFLPGTLFAGHWRLTRPETASTLLVADDRHLRGDAANLSILPGLPRRYTVLVPVPKATPPGLYKGSITVAGQALPISVEVLDVTLPETDKTIGIYLEDLPLHRWFKTSSTEARLCDLSALKSLGLTGVAPPMTSPKTAETLETMMRDIQTVRLAGFSTPLLGYTPLKRLQGTKNWTDQLLRAETELTGRGETIYWSAADEVSNDGHDLEKLKAWIGKIRKAAPTARIAGHFNAERDQEVAPLFDLALINSGYGLNPDTIGTLRDQGTRTMIYNVGQTRLAAGTFLWRNDLDGYLQWHARMPTADPFDPTDGREADVQWLYPTPEECPRVPDIDRGLLDMADGIIDLRWLLWLDQEASRNATAVALRKVIHDRISGDWMKDKRLIHMDLFHLRESITALARNLRFSD
ncbi:hypothetical protein [Nisaea denitrificans]|uniref:hypothetical protein n=1 Tax=Nisaea denitrificans TaxID=390877 RepID=UPI0004007A23|nr:hypothetical protein [Nisaea denitrificans]